MPSSAEPHEAPGIGDAPHDDGRHDGEDAGAAWMRHMRRGDWAAAWALSDAALAARGDTPGWHLPRHEQTLWDGRALDGRRVLVHCYHGLGDTLQFARFLPQLAAVAAEVSVWAQPALMPLLAAVPGVDRLLPLHDGAPDAARDANVEIMELGHVFRVTPATLPGDVPYLTVPAAARAPRAADGRLHVGVVWSCGDWNREQRSIPFALLEPLFRLPGVTLHVLQRGPALAECPPTLGVHDGSDDVVAAAGLVRSLDLVLTVDTMMAHLAGALGAPVWTLLPQPADWRWMEGRDTSPWYPTMRLFRQPTPGDWPAVIARVRDALLAHAAASPPPPARRPPPATHP
ncbi:MAG TPA: hypothetical protein VEZ47_10760 [Gemmatirosa sp.]|nr:hypothetical protein [Gemmatirosa sp.]